MDGAKEVVFYVLYFGRLVMIAWFQCARWLIVFSKDWYLYLSTYAIIRLSD